jgi:hypothetical protein
LAMVRASSAPTVQTPRKSGKLQEGTDKTDKTPGRPRKGGRR